MTSSPDAGAAAGRAQERRQHADGGRLAGAVRAEEAEDLAFLDVEVDAVDGADVGREAHERLGEDRGQRRLYAYAGNVTGVQPYGWSQRLYRARPVRKVTNVTRCLANGCNDVPDICLLQ